MSSSIPPGSFVSRFPLGDMVATPGALAAIRFPDVEKALRRHCIGDWGELDAEDKLQPTTQPTSLSPVELKSLLCEPEEPPAGIGGGISPKVDICTLIKTFPCFEHLGITPDTWDAERFEAQAAKFSSGELAVAQFILGVWNPTSAWKCGKFDFIEAAARLDQEHRQIIAEWLKEPWWP